MKWLPCPTATDTARRPTQPNGGVERCPALSTAPRKPLSANPVLKDAERSAAR